MSNSQKNMSPLELAMGRKLLSNILGAFLMREAMHKAWFMRLAGIKANGALNRIMRKMRA